MTDPITQQQFITAGETKLDPVFLEDVFRSDYYRGTNQVVSSGYGPNLADFGGMTWTKCTSATQYWSVRDTVRGANKWMSCSETHADQTGNSSYSFLTTGQNSGTDGYNGDANQSFTSSSFRKQKGFFDIVTYTGTGVARTINHNLGSVPGAIVVKCTSTTGNWVFGHVDMMGPSDPSISWQYNTYFNTNAARDNTHAMWNNTVPTGSAFSVGTHADVNQDGETYIAYLWASGNDAQSQVFGREGAETNIIKCGSYTGNQSTQTIDVGFRPDWYIIKQASGGVYDWVWWDKYSWGSINQNGYEDGMKLNLNNNSGRSALMRMLTTSGGANAARGFHIESDGWYNVSGQRYVYIAVRSPDMHVCRDGSTGTDGENGVPSQYFTMAQGTALQNNPNGTFAANFGPDVHYFRDYVSSDNTYMGTRDSKTQSNAYTWKMDTGTAASAGVSSNAYFSSKGMHVNYNSNYQAWMWKKGPGMTYVYYEGSGSNRTVYHDLGAVPELIFFKALALNDNNPLWHFGLNNGVNAKYYMLMTDSRGGQVDSRGDWIPNTAAGLDPTSTYFKVGPNSPVNSTSSIIVASLYRSVTGMSKVGYYQGDSGGQTITTGFQPRYMWLKRTDTSDSRFYYLDTLRGWGLGNDQWLEFSDTGGQSSWDFGAPTATGFTLTGGNGHTNANGHNYIYYAHA